MISNAPLHSISYAIAMLGLVGIVWALASADRLLTAGSLTRSWRTGSAVAAALIVSFAVFGGTAGLLGADVWLLRTVNMVLYYALMLAMLGVLVHMSWFGLRRSPKGEGRRVAEFGLLFLVLSCLSVVFIVLPEWMRIIPGFLLLLSFDVYPVYWVRRYLPREVNGRMVALDDPALLESVFAAFAVSKREGEIAELMLKGMSNKEIEDALFISMNTVKNHIYNLYRKLGVSSRGQFVSLLLNEQKKMNGEVVS